MKRSSLVLIAFICISLWFPSAFAGPAPAAAGRPVQPFDTLTWFTQNGKPESVSVAGNPLDYCAGRIGLDARNVELPRGWEGAYRFCCRFPIIDAVANRPLYTKQWAEENADSMAILHRAAGLDVMRYAVSVLRGTRERTLPYSGPGYEAVSFDELLRGSNFTSKYLRVLAELYYVFADAYRKASVARMDLTRDDLKLFYANPGYYLAPDGKKMPELTGDNSTQLEFIEHARRVHYAAIFDAEAVIRHGIQEYLAATKGWHNEDFYADVSRAAKPFEVKTPYGLLRVSGIGNDTVDTDCALLIDIAGDDVYRNNAGGCTSARDGIAVCIDHAGNDQYLAPGRDYVQGFGFLGVGMLIDLAGNDIYRARHFSQGAGIMGVGVLWDRAGDDVYDANAFVQGAGMFGLGMLLDDSGNDQYDCATLGQGAATTLGLGVLSDLSGNDRYGLALKPDRDALGGLPGYGQGGALSFRPSAWGGKLTAYGGVGLLTDAAGDDRYETHGWCDQGGSYIMSLGALVDHAGNDHYIAGTGQGSGIHITNAILIDKQGDDVYEGGFRSGGSGGDRSVSLLLDYAGNDTYKSSTSSYGTGCKPFCYSLMIDYSGDDHYICEEPKNGVTFNNWESFGGTWPESDGASWPYAICMDLGGKDDYQVAKRRNNCEYNSFGHGIHLDMDWRGGDVIGKVENPLEPYPGVPQLTGMPLAPYLKEVLELKSPDLFRRFQAVGKIVSAGSEAVPTLVSAVRESENRQFNRDAMECLNYLLVEKKVLPNQVSLLAGLLKAKDPEVRTVMADNFGVFRFPESKGALAAVLDDKEAATRRFALRSLMALKVYQLLPFSRAEDTRPLNQRVEGLAISDSSPDVRRMAVRYLSRPGVWPALTPRFFTQVLRNDPASAVRCAAAEALGQLDIPARTGFPLDSLATGALREAAQSQDAYVQRACGRALAERGEIEGIGLLIKSLSFPSIDAFYNYDRNVPNSIAAYTNFDLPESTRYQQAKWQEWFDAHRDSIDIKANVAAYRALTALSESLGTAAETLQIQAYESLLAKYPGYRSIPKALAGKLNDVAWNMVTAAPTSPARNLKAGLKYARRMVELADDPNYWDTLIEALVANGLKDEARKLTQDLLKRYPGNAMFETRLKQLK